MVHTPPDNGVPVEIASLREEGLNQQSKEIQTLDEKPEIVGHDAVMEKYHHCFTRHLLEEHSGRMLEQQDAEILIFREISSLAGVTA